jgi:superfamily II DNA helicase RecQ
MVSEQVHEISELKVAAEHCIPAVAITRETIGQSRREGRKIFEEIRRCEFQAIMVSPETLTEPAMSAVLADSQFRENFIELGIDEFHITRPWGKGFRTAFHQLASILWRLPPGTPVVGASATSLPGKPFQDVLDLLRISQNYQVIRESNERPNIRSAALRLSHGLGGALFPDIAFAARGGQKAVIYCDDLSLTFRVATYLRRLLPAGDARFTRVRQWTSLTESGHNAETIRLFRDDPSTTAIVATIAFGMGMNSLQNIRTVSMLGVPSSMDNYKQEEGRAVRDLVTPGMGILYIQNSIWDRLRDGKELSKRRARPGQAVAAER